jgi:acetyl-CoA carboxylase carboxyl transferase subunit alpha
VQLARRPDRPKTLDYVGAMLRPWLELHGDRAHGDDAALIGGVGSLGGRSVVLLGHQRGGDTKENLTRNFGMPHPEGYRKARRLLEMAGKFALPVVCLIDTPAADPGLQSEERGQAHAIAANLYALANLPVPVVVTVIGEGGSGGALAIGAGDRIFMLENSIYSVASPEASATILWRDPAKAPQAAERMKITARDLRDFGIVDDIIPEPGEGAHAEPAAAIEAASARVQAALRELDSLYREGEGYDEARLLADRAQKYRRIGRWQEEQPLVTTPTGAELNGSAGPPPYVPEFDRAANT